MPEVKMLETVKIKAGSLPLDPPLLFSAGSQYVN